MMKRLGMAFVVAVALLATHSNCANRWREASTGRSPDEVGSYLATITTSDSGTSSEASAILAMVENQGATVYYAEAPGEMGPIHAVAPLDFQELSGTTYGINALSSIRVFFIDLAADAGNQNALVLQYKLQNENTYSTKIYSNIQNQLPGGYFQDGEFVVRLKDSSGKVIVVRSFDVEAENEQLAPVVQIELSTIDANGEEALNLGQVSSMEGFSGL